MSDGTNPVRLSHNGRVSEIPVEPVAETINISGAGDTRDGALMFFLSRGDDMETAVTKATVMASIRIQYPCNEWEDHILEHVQDNPLFEDDLDELTTGTKVIQRGLFDHVDVDAEAANDPEGGLDHASNE